ncbi:MAG: ABC transporter ATP-binding protein [Thermoleophilia bacterium]
MSAAAGGPMLDVRGLRRVYADGRESIEAVADLTFQVPRGQFACMVGPSGCGKTTLLRCLAGLLAPTEGAVVMDGAAVTAPPRGMALVLQEYARSLFPWKSVRANVELPLRYGGVPKGERADRVEEALASVGLAGRSRSYPWQLSGGMQQRVALARAIAVRPKVLVMDEPFAAVDAQTRAELEDLVRRLWGELGITVLFVTHDIDEAVYLGERVLVLGPPPRSLRADIPVELPAERDQVATRGLPAFSDHRARLHREIALARA